MKHLLFFLILSCCAGPILAQNRYDNNWVFAFKIVGGNLIHFTDDTLKIEALPPNTTGSTYEALACMSDKAGDLLFYTNNCTVFDKNHEVMENGEGLNPGQIQTYWCSVNPFANPNDNSVLITPMPDNEKIYQIFHWDYEAFNVGQPGGSQFGPLHLYHTVVDMSQNNGLGQVVSKNNLILADTLSSCALQAVRHANGRDWWILAPEFSGNCYYKVLLDPSGPIVVDKQCIGSNWGKYGGGSAHFTNNGMQYVRCDIEYGLNLFDFDRCTGQLSSPVHVPIGPQGEFLLNCMALSPSGRFAYYHTRKEIYQYDLEAHDIGSSKTLVATFDGFQSAGNTTDFYKSQLAPDGKIYINTFGPTYYLHVIEYPDSAGLACEVRQHAIELPIRHFAAMPNYPAYRLREMSGSPCDTISVNIHEPRFQGDQVLVYPNPASGDVTIEHKGGSKIERVDIFDLTGRIVFVDNQSGQAVNMQKRASNLKPGFYLLMVVDDTGRLEIKKIIIE